MSIIERALDKLEKHQDTSRAKEVPAPEDAASPAEAPVQGVERPAAEARAAIGPVDVGDVVDADPRVPAGRGASDATPAARSREVAVDLERLAELGLLSPENPQSRLSEQMRRIKRPLLSKLEEPGAPADRYSNLIMVTSSLSGEGKTFTSINLAISIAMEMDRTVLLVDSDVAKSDITRSLGIEAPRGLSDYLVEEDLELSDVMLRTNIPKLSVLPSGSHHEKMTELLASGGMKHLIDDLSKRYSDRVVIFDSAPVLLTSGASVLASLVGQVVFVVHAETTLASQLKDALKQLNRKENVGLVLNRSREWGGGSYKYGYGYYYYGQE